METRGSKSDKSLHSNKNEASIIFEKSFDISELAEKEIWAAFRNGNEGAFNYIYRTYFQVLFQYGQQFTPDQELVKDLLQDFFIDLRKNRERLGETESIKFYLFKSLRRKIFRFLNRKKFMIFTSDLNPYEGFKIDLSPEIILLNSQLNQERKKVLENHLNKLSKRQREAIYYYFFQELSYQEVAEIMGLSNIKSARNLIYKSLEELKKQFKTSEEGLILFSLLIQIFLLYSGSSIPF
ncbi:RNA polymerase sigma factor [Flexithrix dorotheae]|uniref:RNA polymerase sigma factor n=1 Tax=Flexithrix dorotheae TaxID=70993 RepID=UPI00035EC634|nr:sigma-70 family RNA polymerase sigma factor [Flexithrix dorotheae]